MIPLVMNLLTRLLGPVVKEKVEVLPVLAASHLIIEIPHPCIFWGFLNISSLKKGDVIEVFMLQKGDSDDQVFFPYLTQEYTGVQADKVKDFQPMLVEGVQVRIKQTGGLPRLISGKFYHIPLKI